MSVRTLVKSIQNIMRQDTGVDGDAQRISQLCWMFFLKIIDDQDQELELMQADYRAPIPKRFRWRSWPTRRASPAKRVERCCDASDGACKLRMMRGGSWLSLPRVSRFADRIMNPVGYQDISIGFRAAGDPRTLLRERQSLEPEA